MSSIVKSVRLPDDRMMREFVAKQTNFANAIRYLVMRYCRETGFEHIEDLNQVYKNFVQNNLYDMSSADYETKEKSHEATRSSMGFRRHQDSGHGTNPVAAVSVPNVLAAAAPGVPSCYQ